MRECSRINSRATVCPSSLAYEKHSAAMAQETEDEGGRMGAESWAGSLVVGIGRMSDESHSG